MGDPKHLPTRAPLESSADEIPTQILSQKPGEEYGDDDGNTIEHRNETTVRADVDTTELQKKAPLPIAPLAPIAPIVGVSGMQPKVPRPAASIPPAPGSVPPHSIPKGSIPPPPAHVQAAVNEFLEAIEPIEGDDTEVGKAALLVEVEHPADREEHTARLEPAMVANTLGKSLGTAPMGMKPVPIPTSSSATAANDGSDDDQPYDVPGLESRVRSKWMAIGLLMAVLVGIGGVVIGRFSAKSPAPTGSSAAAMVTAPVSTSSAPDPESRNAIPPPPSSPSASPPSEEELDNRARQHDSPKPIAPPAPAPAPPPAPPPAPVVHAPAPHPHVAPHPRPATKPAPASGIVRDAPF